MPPPPRGRRRSARRVPPRRRPAPCRIACNGWSSRSCGRDRTVYGLPWATLGLVAVCTLVHLSGFVVERKSSERVEVAIARAEAILQAHPDARIHWQPADLPRTFVSRTFARLYEPDPTQVHEGDAELDVALRELLDALWDIPSNRFGYRAGRPRAYTVLTSMFVHADIFHLLGNMVFLVLAGAVVESFWGRGPYLVLYFVSGWVGLLAHHLSAPLSLLPLVGASGAISGLLGAFVVCHPTTTVRVGYFVWYVLYWWKGVMELPAWFCIPAWAAFQLLFATAGEGDGVAYWAHLGGFVVGVAGGLLMKHKGWLEPDLDTLERLPEPGVEPAVPFHPVAATRPGAPPDLTSAADELPTL